MSSVGLLDPGLGGVSSALLVERSVVLEDTSLLGVLLVFCFLLLGFLITDLLVLRKSQTGRDVRVAADLASGGLTSEQ